MTNLPSSHPPATTPPTTPEARYAWALATCRARHLRLTHAREHILHYLAHHPAPVSWETLAQAPELRGCCDPATISRTLGLLKEAQLVRSIRTTGKVSYYALNVPGAQAGLVICRRCGKMAELPLPPSVIQPMKQLAHDRGFSWATQELACYGLCRACETALAQAPPPTKLTSTPRSKKGATADARCRSSDQTAA